MIEKFKKFQLITAYLDGKEVEIKQFNEHNNIDQTELINGRHLTNVGVFRKYVESYLVQNPNLNTDMTCMVRQLPSSEIGLPIEIYTFSKNKEWVKYENIQADLFDHIFAAVPNFELEIFESPSGADFRKIAKR